MARNEYLGDRNRSPRPGSRDRRESNYGRDSEREYNRYSEDRGLRRSNREFQKTKVTCSSCGKECEVPFKPKTSKPVFCDVCFSKKGKPGVSNPLIEKEIELINEKLDKIMKGLGIE